MTATWEKKEGNEGLLKVTVPAEKVDKALDQAFKKVVKQINVPGFRKGKVPRPIFEQRFGVEALYQDAVDILLPEAYGEAIDETGINPVAQPEINVTQIEKGKDFEFEATVTVEPEVQLGDYKGLEIEKQDSELTDEDLQEAIDHSLGHLADMVVKEDGAVENGDTVNIDFDGYVDGEQFEGGQADGYDLEIGSGSFIPGFEDQLVGVKTGEEKDVVVTFPEEYHADELAGKDATFKVKVHEVKTKEVPELDDEFAKDVDEEVETLDELKEKYRKELTEQKEAAAKEAREEEALRLAVENAEITELPHEMVHEEVHRQMDHYLNEMQRSGISKEMYFQLTGTTEADLHAQFEEDADTRVKTNLILEQIVEDENITAKVEDVEKEIATLAETYNMTVEEVKNVVTEDMLKNDIALKKAMALITDTVEEA